MILISFLKYKTETKEKNVDTESVYIQIRQYKLNFFKNWTPLYQILKLFYPLSISIGEQVGGLDYSMGHLSTYLVLEF